MAKPLGQNVISLLSIFGLRNEAQALEEIEKQYRLKLASVSRNKEKPAIQRWRKDAISQAKREVEEAAEQEKEAQLETILADLDSQYEKKLATASNFKQKQEISKVHQKERREAKHTVEYFFADKRQVLWLENDAEKLKY